MKCGSMWILLGPGTASVLKVFTVDALTTLVNLKGVAA